MTDLSADKEGPFHLAFAGSATILTSQDIHARLLQAVESGRDVEIECSDVTEADLSFVQLLLAARRSAEARRQRLTLCSPATEALQQTLLRAGLAAAGPGGLSPDEDFWKGNAS